MSFEPQYPADDIHPAAARTSTPGIFLIIVGAFNVLWGGYVVTAGVLQFINPEIAIKNAEMLAELFPAAAAQKPKPEEVQRQSLLTVGIGILVLVGCVLTILGGIRMRQLRTYGLAMTGSIVAAVPCLSCMGCCGVGEVIGIWAIVVLLNEEVKAAFH